MLMCLLLSLSLRSGATAAPGNLHTDMWRTLQEEGLTGAVWTTVVADGSSAVDAAGLMHAGSRQRMHPDHRVHVGSVAKVVLAAGVLRLITEGRLSLDTPIAELLPSLAFDNPWHDDGDPILLRHLLMHTAGLDNLRFWQVFSLKPQADTPLVEAFAGDPSLLRVRARPGSRFSYSNMGYALLGMVIESVTGEAYEHYLDTQLLQPLSMHDSTFAFVSQTGAHADPRLAMGHFEDGVIHPAVPAYLRPAMQFTTTAADMARFAHFLMGDGAVDGASFIDRALLANLASPAGTEAALAGLSLGHGLALAQRDRHGVVGVCHSGNTVGFMAMLCLYPAHGKAFFVAMNTDSETADYDRFNALLIRALDIDASAPTPAGVPAEEMRDWQGIYVPALNAMSTLAWIDTTLNFVRVRWDGSHLRIKPFQSGERVLVPTGGLLFRANDRTADSHVLLQSLDGTRVLSDGLHSYEQTSLTRMALLWASLAAGLLGAGYIVLSGLARALTGRLHRTSTLLVPLLAILALSVPVPFFLRQSFLQLGDVTLASISLAVVTGILPLAMMVGLVVGLRRNAYGVMNMLDLSAIMGVLQWMIVLATWNLLPVRLWI
ncbi:MAG: beta-lactamase family protein [Pseudomonadota bacterium]|nr:beta-lactamase family protein [Pseudomonadota bacterium]